MVQFAEGSITGYSLDQAGNVTKLGNNILKEAASILTDILKGIDLEADVPEEDVEPADVCLTPGWSSNTPTIKVKINGEWKKFGDGNFISKAPLAEITSHLLSTTTL